MPTPIPTTLAVDVGHAAVRETCVTGFAVLIAPIVDALQGEGMATDIADGLAMTLIAAYEGATALARVQRSRPPWSPPPTR